MAQSWRGGEKTSTSTAPSGPATTECGTFPRIRQVPPGATSPASPPISKLSEPEIEHSELLVLVAVLGHFGVRLELEQSERHALSHHGPGRDAVPDLEGRHRARVVEGVQCDSFESYSPLVPPAALAVTTYLATS